MINHTVGSSEAFLRLALSGVAYCLIPRLQIIEELESGALIDITPGFLLSYRIYWHHWQLESGGIKRDLSSDIKLCPQPLTSVSCWFLQRQSCVRSPVAGLVM